MFQSPSRLPPARTLRPTSRGKIIGSDARIRSVLSTLDRVARSSCTVLVTGESGTGKELFVAALHDASARSGSPLVTINCGAIPVDLVESELFGHAKGAFTGAQSARHGHVAAAEGGTLFLDEVGELPLAVQVKLLRLLQQREYTPLGESRAIKCDVRIVAATNRDLAAEVAAGRFREDLYYRLNVIHVHLPPLRERKLDTRLLAEHFFSVCARRSGRDDLQGLSPAALAAIDAKAWPGNVRALENAVERGVLLAAGPLVEAEDLFAEEDRPLPSRKISSTRIEIPVSVSVEAARPGALSATASGVRHASNPNFPRVLPDAGVDLTRCAERYQNNLIEQALLRTGGNKNRAAQLLGLNRTTLVEMIRRRGI
ncbi:MAG: sigma-54-dependent Fis family transcriptional regulator [Labilithrix sp.]|nr:sigma-54-dependent Fis family transcriptional regulator [Labilithrix sp.]